MADRSLEAVIDTNVVVKFFVEELGSDKAHGLLQRAILGKLRLIALDFLFIEFVNVIWTKTYRGELTETEAIEKIGQLIALSSIMEIIPSRAILLECFQVARDYDQAAYDAAFLALAEGRSTSFVTADEKFYRKICLRSKAAILLADWQPEPPPGSDA